MGGCLQCALALHVRFLFDENGQKREKNQAKPIHTHKCIQTQ